MADTPWTPGPWFYRPEKNDDWGWVRGGDSGHLVACARAGRTLHENDLADFRTRKADPYEANARLIAAAPEMAEVLEELASDLEAEINARYAYRDRYPTEQKAWERDLEPVHRARALLARIKGEAS
jgi:hypothetical protein